MTLWLNRPVENEMDAFRRLFDNTIMVRANANRNSCKCAGLANLQSHQLVPIFQNVPIPLRQTLRLGDKKALRFSGRCLSDVRKRKQHD